MSKYSRGDSNTPESVLRYKKMQKDGVKVYFDISEFVEIIDYFLERTLISKADEAIAHAKQMHRHSNEIRLKEAQVFIDKKHFAEAENILNELRAVIPAEPDLYFLYGYMYAMQEEYEFAEPHFRKFVKLKPKNETGDAYSSVAFVYVQSGGYDEALEYLNSAEKLLPDSSYVLYDTAYCYEKIGKYVLSIKYYNKYLDSHPFSANVWYNLAIAYDLNGQSEEAIQAYDFALTLNPKFLSSIINKAHTELNNGKYANALKSYESFLRYEPNSSEALTGVGDAYRFMSDFEQATEYYRRALRQDKYFTRALYGIALVYYEKNYNFEGLNFVLRALKKDKLNADYHYLAALFFDRLDYVEKAEQSFVNAIENNPFMPNMWISFADLFVEKQTEKAIIILEEAGQLLPNAGQIFYRLTAIFHQLRNFTKAEEYLQKAIAEEPTYLEEFLADYPKIAEYESLKKLPDDNN